VRARGEARVPSDPMAKNQLARCSGTPCFCVRVEAACRSTARSRRRPASFCPAELERTQTQPGACT